MIKFLKNLLFWRDTPVTRLKKWFKWPMVIIVIILLIASVSIVVKSIKNGNGEEVLLEKQIVKNVKTQIVNLDAQYSDNISTVGIVKAGSRVDVVALTKGTVRGFYFEVGDKVNKNKVLVNLFNSSLSTSYNNARTNLSNARNSLESTKLITNETIKQAESGVDSALEKVNTAEIALKTADDNLANAKSLQQQGDENAKENAITLYYSYLNSINSTLDQVNYIILAEPGVQIDGIDGVLGVKNIASINMAKNSFISTRNFYNKANIIKPTNKTIKDDLENIINGLSLAIQAVDDTIIILNNTISSFDFSEAALNAQKSSFSTLRNSIIGTKTNAELTLQGLEKLNPVNKQEIDALENAIKSAENQLSLAQIGYENALITLASAKQGKDQQIIGSQALVDSAQGQLNITGTQVADLTVRAPIRGTITKKFVELGAEVNPGQKIAEISQTDNVKVEIDLPSEDIYRVKVGQEVLIRGDLKAEITLIDPVADSITRKVRVEIMFNNENKDLISGTFVDVNIPVEELNKTHPQSVFIPLQAINITQNENFVFTIADGRAKKILVVIGKTEGSLIEILDGLNNNDVLVINGGKSLEDRDEVKEINSK